MTSPDCDGLFLVSNCFGSCRTILRVKSTYKLFNVLEQKVISFGCELVSLVTTACFCFVWFFNGDRFGFFRLLADSMTIISSSTVEYPLPTKKKPFLEVKLLKCVGFYEYKRKGNNQTLDNMINSIKTLKPFCFRCFFFGKKGAKPIEIHRRCFDKEKNHLQWKVFLFTRNSSFNRYEFSFRNGDLFNLRPLTVAVSSSLRFSSVPFFERKMCSFFLSFFPFFHHFRACKRATLLDAARATGTPKAEAQQNDDEPPSETKQKVNQSQSWALKKQNTGD